MLCARDVDEVFSEMIAFDASNVTARPSLQQMRSCGAYAFDSCTQSSHPSALSALRLILENTGGRHRQHWLLNCGLAAGLAEKQRIEDQCCVMS